MRNIIMRRIKPINCYRLSWDSKMKKIATIPISEETFYTVITTNLPQTLCLISSESNVVGPSKSFASNILEKCKLSYDQFSAINIVGSHDVHITNPNVVASHIIEFLSNDENKLSKCKL